MKKYYKIDADLSLLLASPKKRQITEISQIAQENKAVLEEYLDDNFSSEAMQERYEASDTKYHYLICAKSANAIVGEITLDKSFDGKTLDLSYFIDKKVARQGMMTKTLSFLQEELLEKEGFDVLRAIIDADNIASIKVARNCGFQVQHSFAHTYTYVQTKDSLDAFLRKIGKRPPKEKTPRPKRIDLNALAKAGRN